MWPVCFCTLQLDTSSYLVSTHHTNSISFHSPCDTSILSSVFLHLQNDHITTLSSLSPPHCLLDLTFRSRSDFLWLPWVSLLRATALLAFPEHTKNKTRRREDKRREESLQLLYFCILTILDYLKHKTLPLISTDSVLCVNSRSSGWSSSDFL